MAALLVTLLAFSPLQTTPAAPEARRREFIELMRTLPARGEFYTPEAVRRAGPHLPVLLSLTEGDIEGLDLYPFLALSSGLSGVREHRAYAARHFSAIRHPALKLGWAVLLFDAGPAPAQVRRFLREALASEESSKLLAEMLGPDFGDFKRRVTSRRRAR